MKKKREIRQRELETQTTQPQKAFPHIRESYKVYSNQEPIDKLVL